MENPFNYLQFATGDRFYDREEIRRDLRSRLLSGQTNVVLYGPRRYGKSSLVAELTADLENDVAVAYDRLVGLNRDQYEQLMLTFSIAQKKLLVALAHENTHEFDDAYRRRFRLGPSSTVNSAKRKLIEDGHIEQFESECRIADPFFAEFLRSV